jgi:hypothetical protein
MVKNMKVYFKLIIFSLSILSIVLQISSCNDPIFYKVHEETEILEPVISGSPLNFVVYNDKLYTASGKRIFLYSNGDWSEWKRMDSNVMMLASTDDSLYILYYSNSSGMIRRFYDNGNSSEDFNLPHDVQSIYTFGDILFASVRDNNIYTIYYLDENTLPLSYDLTIIADTESESLLSGAAFDGTYYYLCNSSGIFCIEKNTLSSVLSVIEPDTGFSGMINLNDDYIAAISIDGRVFEINNAVSTEVVKTDFDSNHSSTGALTLWYSDKNDVIPSLLLAGRKEIYYSTSTGNSNGYVEFELDETGRIKQDTGYSEPGKNVLSSVENYDRYSSSLGKKPVNYIIQTPSAIDEEMTLFASTQQNGVWSYRIRSDGWGWNAEE